MTFRRGRSGLLIPEEGLSIPRANIRGLREWMDAATIGTLVGAKPPSAPTTTTTSTTTTLAPTYTDKVLSYSPIAYWPLAEASGTTADNAEGTAARDGTYNSDVSAWPVGTGIGDGNGAPTFSGDDNCNIYTASLAGAFDGDEFTIGGWAKVSGAGDWSDATYRWMLELQGSDIHNRIYFAKTNAANQLRLHQSSNSTVKEVLSTVLAGTTAWFHVCITASVVADEVKCFIDGSQVGSTLTGLGAWSAPLNSGFGKLGMQYVTAGVWKGYLAHWFVFDSALSPTDVGDLASL